MNIMSPDIDIICLPENENPRPCDTCYIAGWGRGKFGFIPTLNTFESPIT